MNPASDATTRAVRQAEWIVLALCLVVGVVAGLLGSLSLEESIFRGLFLSMGVGGLGSVVTGMLLLRGQIAPRPHAASPLASILKGCGYSLFCLPNALLPWQDKLGFTGPGALALFWATFPVMILGFLVESRATKRLRRETWLAR